MNRQIGMCLAVAVLAIASIAEAETIYIDIHNGAAGSLTPDSSGRYWNTIIGDYNLGAMAPQVLADNMVDGSNNATEVDFYYVGGFNNPIGSVDAFHSLVDWDNAAYDDRWYTNSTGLIEIQDLDPSKTYDLELYGSSNSTQSFRGFEVTIGDNAQATDFSTSGGEALFTFTGIAPADNGILVISFPTAGVTYTYFTGMTISYESGGGGDVPEPGTMLLLGTGLIGALGVIRRRKLG